MVLTQNPGSRSMLGNELTGFLKALAPEPAYAGMRLTRAKRANHFGG